MDAGDLMSDAVLKGMWTKIVTAAERTLTKEFDCGGDPELVAKKYAAKIERIGKDIKQRLARERLNALSTLGDEDEETPWRGTGEGEERVWMVITMGDKLRGVTLVTLPQFTPTNLSPPPNQVVEHQQVAETQFAETENLTLRRALEYAAVGIAVFPLHNVYDGICSCNQASECKSAGKHPLARLVPNGVKDATTEPALIKRWFEAHPHANLAIAMGGVLRLIALDSDPRNGGDASVFDLVEAHGGEWLETHTVRTGGNGNHFIYRLPEGVEIHKGKIAPGIDVKAEGGYLVAPPSLHASGRSYEVEKNVDIAFASEWIIEELTRPADVQPKNMNSRWNVREALGNAFESISAAAARGADWKQSLAAGAGGVAGGFINPAAGEQRAQNKEVGLLERRVGSARQREEQRWDNLYKRSRATNEAMEPERAARDAQSKTSQGERELIVKLYNEVDDFDPDSPDPRTQEVVARASAAGVPLMKKSRRDRTSMQVTPDGRVFLHDGGGNVREAADPKTGQPFNVARPGAFKLDTLTDDMFGLPSDKQIEDMARSRVPQAAKTRRIRPEVERMFSNQDGQFDQQALDDAIRLKQVSISDAYENVDPPGVEQALARERERVRSTTAGKRQMVADFRLRLGNARPNPTGEAMPVGVLTEKFRQILALPPKQQQEQIKQFYAALPMLNLQ